MSRGVFNLLAIEGYIIGEFRQLYGKGASSKRLPALSKNMHSPTRITSCDNVQVMMKGVPRADGA